jgi:succinate dehydrogenase flavin-adding protein (antitoxin of CptAB toxin-antitoxin module)
MNELFRSLRFFSSSLNNVGKLKYLATKRGIVENELIFDKFFSPGAGWDLLNAQKDSSQKDKEIQLLNDFLLEYDWDIFAWISGQRPVPEPYKSSQMFKLIQEGLKKGRSN